MVSKRIYEDPLATKWSGFWFNQHSPVNILKYCQQNWCDNLKTFFSFHDESNIVALSEVNCWTFFTCTALTFLTFLQFPSSYSKNRKKAFEFTLNLMKNNNSTLGDLPQFIFGDFNFRLDTQSVVQRMTNNAKPTKILSANGEISRLIYRNTQTDRHLTVEKKHFLYSDPNFFSDKINIDSVCL